MNTNAGWIYLLVFCQSLNMAALQYSDTQMKTEQDKKDFLQRIQDKRNGYQRFGTSYDDAEMQLNEQQPKQEENEETAAPEKQD